MKKISWQIIVYDMSFLKYELAYVNNCYILKLYFSWFYFGTDVKTYHCSDLATVESILKPYNISSENLRITIQHIQLNDENEYIFIEVPKDIDIQPDIQKKKKRKNRRKHRPYK